MTSRDELLRTPEYWLEQAQNELFRQVTAYMEAESLDKSSLAKRLDISESYVAQILAGQFNGSLTDLIEISLAIGKIPMIEYKAWRS